MRLENKIAIVTGASKGIGKGIAETFAKEGANLVITCLTDMEGLEDTYNKIVSYERKALKLQIDIGELDDIDRMISTTVEEFGRLDILVNNAATRFFKKITELTEDEWDRTMATGVKGSYFATQRAIPEMKKVGKGKVIHLASTASFGGLNEGFSSYAVSKAAIVQMTKSMAIELAPMHINVNAIAPGPIAHFQSPSNIRTFSDPARISWYMERLPCKRFGTVEDVAHAAVYLASDEADWVHGTILLIDGGWRSY